MTLTLPTDALSMSVTHVNDDTATFSVPSDDILSVNTTHQAGTPTDEGRIVVDNGDGKYTSGGDDSEIYIGDQLVVTGYTGQTREEMEDTPFGSAPFGTAPYGGHGRIGTYRVLDWDIVEHSPGESDLVLEVADYVFSILSDRVPFYGASGRDIAGHEDAILNELLAENAPEINRSALPNIPGPMDYYTSGGRSLREIVGQLASITREEWGPVFLTSYGYTLYFQPLEDILVVEDEPMDHHFSDYTVSTETDDMANSVILTGGIDDEGNLDDAQETVSQYYNVTNTDLLWTQLSTRKSQISTIEVYTYGAGGASEGGVRVRLQASNSEGDGPINPTETSSDIVASSRRKVALDDDGWTTFHLGEHTIPERDPWLIVDSDDETGHMVGVDSTNNVGYRAYFPKPVMAEVPDAASINRYGLREKHIINESLVTKESVQMRAGAELERRAEPTTVVGPVTCETNAAHKLTLGDVVVLERPEYRVDGEYLVTSKSQEYDAADHRLRSEVTFSGALDYV